MHLHYYEIGVLYIVQINEKKILLHFFLNLNPLTGIIFLNIKFTKKKMSLN